MIVSDKSCCLSMPGIMTSSDEDENRPPCKPAELVGAEKNDDGGEVWLH